MTWRERIQAARERGGFGLEDYTAWAAFVTCPAGEVARACGVTFTERDGSLMPVYPTLEWYELWRIGSSDFQAALFSDDFDAADKALDAIEDRALQLKRETACEGRTP